MNKVSDRLLGKIKDRTARIGIIGMGYVGLPLAVEFGKAGFTVTGIDIDSERVKALQAGRSYIGDVPSGELKALVSAGRFNATMNPEVMRDLDTVTICVPTPLRKTKDPDLSYIIKAAESILMYLHSGQLIILESKTYPGTTDEVLLPMLEGSGLKVGKDFFLAFSPERVDPGN